MSFTTSTGTPTSNSRSAIIAVAPFAAASAAKSWPSLAPFIATKAKSLPMSRLSMLNPWISGFFLGFKLNHLPSVQFWISSDLKNGMLFFPVRV